MSALDAVSQVAVDACDGDEVDAMALLSGAICQLALRAADEAAVAAKPEDAPYPPVNAVRVPAGRMLRRIAEQMESWAAFMEAIEARHLPATRKRIGAFADRDARDLAGRLKLALRRGAGTAETPPEPPLPERRRPERQPARRCSAPPCAKCGGSMLPKNGRNGPYMSCEHYPECRTTTNGAHLGVACLAPDCDGHLVERLLRNSGGGQQELIVGCSNYPLCRFADYASVEDVPCFLCKLPFIVVDGTGRRRCIDPTCATTGVIAQLDAVTLIVDMLRLASRVAGSMERAAPLLAAAGGFACGEVNVSEPDAVARFASAYAIGVRDAHEPVPEP